MQDPIPPSERRALARKKVQEMRSFYIHLLVYLVINALLLIRFYVDSQEAGTEFWDFAHFTTPLFWGVGLAIHLQYAFGLDLLLGKNWEQRKIRKFMEADRDQNPWEA